ncbi:MAG: hypothetical protein LBH59_02595 [Planctomycetaceae bacterium]|nr:hypothetical protein [Planctomycetaceae bacterium]
MNKRFAMLRLPFSALRILKRLQHSIITPTNTRVNLQLLCIKIDLHEITPWQFSTSTI